MINDGREFLIKRRRGNSAKCSAFSLWRSQSENRVPRGCSGSRRCFLFTAVPGGPHRLEHRRRGSSRIRSVMSAVRSTYGTVRIKLLVFQNSSGGGAGRRRPRIAGRALLPHALQSARTGRALAASGISWTDGETSNTTPNVNLSPTPFRLLEGFTLRPCARSVRGQVAHRRVSAHDLR